MSIWGKLSIAATQHSVAGPIAALLGGGWGYHVFDRNQKQDQPAENQLAFTVGVIALSAKMAKSDGVVTKDEVSAFKEAFKVSDLEMRQAAHIFNLAKLDVAGYGACAEQLVRTFEGDRKLCLKVSSTSLRPTTCSTRGRNSSSVKSPSASVFPTPSSAISRPATSSPPNATPMTSWASSRLSAMKS